tara:strand:- start:67 stop:603 length:537 start_codon:yes stop_codon:yes gene_type:complete
MIKHITFLHFFTAACIVELFMVTIFRYSGIRGNKWMAINNWYTNLRWTAVILDIISVLIGFYIAKFIYEYLVTTKLIDDKHELLKFLGIVVCVQIIHDFSFYFLVIKDSKMGSSLVMDEFIRYSKSVGINAVIGDSIMYLLATPLVFYFVNVKSDVNVFSSLVSLYLIGYFIYQKPLS